jgi:hypothetical protein
MSGQFDPAVQSGLSCAMIDYRLRVSKTATSGLGLRPALEASDTRPAVLAPGPNAAAPGAVPRDADPHVSSVSSRSLGSPVRVESRRTLKEGL